MTKTDLYFSVLQYNYDCSVGLVSSYLTREGNSKSHYRMYQLQNKLHKPNLSNHPHYLMVSPEPQIRWGLEDDSGIIFLQINKNMFWPIVRSSGQYGSC